MEALKTTRHASKKRVLKTGKIIKICGMLLQTKVYLFWRKEKRGDA
jgi:hypothetical protein